MSELTITVVLAPNDKYRGQPPDPSWPRPQGVTLRLTKKAAKKADRKPVDLDPTDSEGVVRIDKLAARSSYQVTVLDDYFKKWTLAGEVKVDDDDCARDVVLVPPKGR